MYHHKYSCYIGGHQVSFSIVHCRYIHKWMPFNCVQRMGLQMQHPIHPYHILECHWFKCNIPSTHTTYLNVIGSNATSHPPIPHTWMSLVYMQHPIHPYHILECHWFKCNILSTHTTNLNVIGSNATSHPPIPHTWMSLVQMQHPIHPYHCYHILESHWFKCNILSTHTTYLNVIGCTIQMGDEGTQTYLHWYEAGLAPRPWHFMTLQNMPVCMYVRTYGRI